MSNLADKLNNNAPVFIVTAKVKKSQGVNSELVSRRYKAKNNNISIIDKANLEFG